MSCLDVVLTVLKLKAQAGSLMILVLGLCFKLHRCGGLIRFSFKTAQLMFFFRGRQLEIRLTGLDHSVVVLSVASYAGLITNFP